MKPEILIVAALEKESNGLFETLGHEVLYTGVGKLNAAIRLMKKLHRKPTPVAVINLGTAGSFLIKPKTVVSVKEFIERDFDFMGLSKPITTNGEVGGVVCGSGDTFLGRASLMLPSKFVIADMEGYALAKVCGMYGVPFVSWKCVSDDGSTQDWNNSLQESSKLLVEHAAPFIREIEKLYL